MAKATQLTISVEDRPGTLAQVARVLGEARVNILALLGSGPEGAVHVVVDNAGKAKRALQAAKLPYREQQAVQADLPNKPGALAQHLAKLASKGVNLAYAYATTTAGAKKASIVLVAQAVQAKAAGR